MKYVLFAVLGLAVVGAWLAYDHYYIPAYAQGEKAPDFDMKLIDGRSAKLSDLRGQYVLLDFWGSWCGPCRRENPSLVKLYDTFHGKSFKDASGFEIVSIGLETSADRWKAAIANDGLNWPYHHADFDRMKSPIALNYGVHSIPAKFLINPDGMIIGVNPPEHLIRDILSSNLK